jgi:hypothetical protein
MRVILFGVGRTNLMEDAGERGSSPLRQSVQRGT